MSTLKATSKNTALKYGLYSGTLISILSLIPIFGNYVLFFAGLIYGIFLSSYYHKSSFSNFILILFSLIGYASAIAITIRELGPEGMAIKSLYILPMYMFLGGTAGALILTIGINIILKSFSIRKNIIIGLLGGLLTFPLFISMILTPYLGELSTLFMYFPLFLVWQTGIAWILSKLYPR